MQLIMGVPQLVEVVDSGSIGLDPAILACLFYKLLCVFGITANLAPVPACHHQNWLICRSRVEVLARQLLSQLQCHLLSDAIVCITLGAALHAVNT